MLIPSSPVVVRARLILDRTRSVCY